MYCANVYGINAITGLNEPHIRDKIIDNIYEDSSYVFESLNLVECSMPLLDYLNDGVKNDRFDLVIATHTVNNMRNLDHDGVRKYKINWLSMNIEPRWPNLIKYDGQVMAFTGEGVDTKSMIARDNVLLIDCQPRNISEFLINGGHGILVNEGYYFSDEVISEIEKFLVKQKQKV